MNQIQGAKEIRLCNTATLTVLKEVWTGSKTGFAQFYVASPEIRGLTVMALRPSGARGLQRPGKPDEGAWARRHRDATRMQNGENSAPRTRNPAKNWSSLTHLIVPSSPGSTHPLFLNRLELTGQALVGTKQEPWLEAFRRTSGTRNREGMEKAGKGVGVPFA